MPFSHRVIIHIILYSHLIFFAEPFFRCAAVERFISNQNIISNGSHMCCRSTYLQSFRYYTLYKKKRHLCCSAYLLRILLLFVSAFLFSHKIQSSYYWMLLIWPLFTYLPDRKCWEISMFNIWAKLIFVFGSLSILKRRIPNRTGYIVIILLKLKVPNLEFKSDGI